MREQKYGFMDGELMQKAEQSRGNVSRAFDWDKAAEIIKDYHTRHGDLICEAGLKGDWAYTGGVIFENGLPTNDSYTYLSSTWATPCLVLCYNGKWQEEIECYCVSNDRFNESTKWDDTSLAILGISL